MNTAKSLLALYRGQQGLQTDLNAVKETGSRTESTTNRIEETVNRIEAKLSKTKRTRVSIPLPPGKDRNTAFLTSETFAMLKKANRGLPEGAQIRISITYMQPGFPPKNVGSIGLADFQ